MFGIQTHTWNDSLANKMQCTERRSNAKEFQFCSYWGFGKHFIFVFVARVWVCASSHIWHMRLCCERVCRRLNAICWRKLEKMLKSFEWMKICLRWTCCVNTHTEWLSMEMSEFLLLLLNPCHFPKWTFFGMAPHSINTKQNRPTNWRPFDLGAHCVFFLSSANIFSLFRLARRMSEYASSLERMNSVGGSHDVRIDKVFDAPWTAKFIL